MAETKGMLKTCDRCGETFFLEVLGGIEMDAGITRWDKFEKTPEGWNWRRETGTLCPKCDEEYNKLLERFMNNKED